MCLRLHEKTFGNQKFPGDEPLDPFKINVKYFFLLNCKPTLSEKLNPPLFLLNETLECGQIFILACLHLRKKGQHHFI